MQENDGAMLAGRAMGAFQERFGPGGDVRVYFAPGRVNLIGEHTDYNGGAAMPGALEIGTWLVARPREDRTLRFFSGNFEEDGVIEADLGSLERRDEQGWTNYPLGVIWAFAEKGMRMPHGLDVYVWGNLPNGAGLSSSASVEVGTGLMLSDIGGFEATPEDLAYLGQKAENEFCGMNCGIMDQMAIATGQEGHIIYLRTSPVAYEHVPFELEGATVVIASTNKQRKLGESKYNERRAECEKALSELKGGLDIQSLGDLTNEELEAHMDLIRDPVRQRRARHAVSENQRVIRARAALERGDVAEFGRLMVQSHESLRDDYEVTGPELDTLVEAALRQKGVLGSRMTGAGFGGCTVSIVEDGEVDAFIGNVGREYEERIGYAADFYPVRIGGGPRRVS